jgi:hypothetical protein
MEFSIQLSRFWSNSLTPSSEAPHIYYFVSVNILTSRVIMIPRMFVVHKVDERDNRLTGKKL